MRCSIALALFVSLAVASHANANCNGSKAVRKAPAACTGQVVTQQKLVTVPGATTVRRVPQPDLLVTETAPPTLALVQESVTTTNLAAAAPCKPGFLQRARNKVSQVTTNFANRRSNRKASKLASQVTLVSSGTSQAFSTVDSSTVNAAQTRAAMQAQQGNEIDIDMDVKLNGQSVPFDVNGIPITPAGQPSNAQPKPSLPAPTDAPTNR